MFRFSPGRRIIVVMADVDRLLAGIDEGLDGLPSAADFQDRRRAIEDEVWADLSTWYSAEEATNRFLAWRGRYVAQTALSSTTSFDTMES